MALLRSVAPGLLLMALLPAAAGCSSRVDVGRFLTSGRDGWQLPEKVVATLALTPGSVVAEIGAGDGYWLPWLSRAVGEDGRVYAVEIEEEKATELERFIAASGLANVHVILATTDDAGLPEGSVDLAMTCNTYHHFEERPAYFAALRESLVDGGRVAHLDNRHDAFFALRWLFGDGHWSDPALARREMAEAGYRCVAHHDYLLTQWFQIFSPAQAEDGAQASDTSTCGPGGL